MGNACGASHANSGESADHSAASKATGRKSKSSQVRALTSTELMPVNPPVPSEWSRRRPPSARHRRKQRGDTYSDESHAEFNASQSMTSARDERQDRQRVSRDSSSSTSSAQTKPQSVSDGPTQRSHRPRKSSTSSREGYKGESQAPQPVRTFHLRKKSAAEAKTAAAPGTTTPAKSLETSRVLSTPPCTTPPTPSTCQMRSARRSNASLPAVAPLAATAAPAEPPAATAPTTRRPKTDKGAAAVDHKQRPGEAPKVSKASPPPVHSRAAASPSPAIGPGMNSFNNPFPSHVGTDNQFSAQSLEQQPSVSADMAGSDQPSFQYENGYGMFFIDPAGGHQGVHSDAATAPALAAALMQTDLYDTPQQQQSLSSLETTPQTIQPLSRRSRRESFVSFGGEIRM